MKIAIVCNDTRGGIQPYVALGKGLAMAGHDVVGIAPSEFGFMFNGVGLSFAPLSGGGQVEMEAATRVAERGTVASMRLMARELPARIERWTRETLSACGGVDLISGGIGGMVTGLPVAEKLGVPFVETHLQPVGVSTDIYPGPMFPGVPRWLGKPGVRFSHRLTDWAVWLPFKGAMMKARKNVLGLQGAPPHEAKGAVLYGFSKHVVPLPVKGRRPRHVVGYWFLPTPANWSPPDGLEAFVAVGPVVSIGFGSMSSSDASAMTTIAVSAVRRAGLRAVLLSGWGGLASFDASDIYCADAVPHDWLFPKMAAVVHHGGAGTAGAAFRAGVPAIVVPFTADQPFWGSRVVALGSGPRPIPRKRLDADNLSAALRQAVSDQSMQARAGQLGALIRREDGVQAAVDVFSRLDVR